MSRRRLIAALVAVVFAAGALAPAGAFAQPREEAGFSFPIWLSPALDLKSISDIDARLERTLDSDERIDVTRNGVASSRQPARNCSAMIALTAQGFRPDAGVDNYLFSIQKTTCEAVAMLRKARQARESQVRTFTLTEVSLRYLPARIDPSLVCGQDGRWPGGDLISTSWRDHFGYDGVGANARGRPLVTVRNQAEMTVKTSLAEITFELLARGDFNDDGYEDLIVRVSRDFTGAVPGTANVFLMTRETPDSMLRLIDDRCSASATSVRPR